MLIFKYIKNDSKLYYLMKPIGGGGFEFPLLQFPSSKYSSMGNNNNKNKSLK